MNRIAIVCAHALLMLCAIGSSHAQSLILAGHLDDPANTALVGSDLAEPSFIDARAVANNVALYTLNVVSTGLVTIQSTGFATGGVDPYFSLFRGAANSANWVDSNHLQAFSIGGDFTFSAVLPAGPYRLALGAFANMSYAENLGSGSLADGFTAIGVPDGLGNGGYRLLVSSPVPEPVGWMLWALGASGLLLFKCTRQRQRQGRHSVPGTANGCTMSASLGGRQG